MITKNINGQNLSANYGAVVVEPARDWEVRLKVNNEFLDCAIKKLEITKGSCGTTESFSIGNVFSSMMTAELMELETDIKGEDIEVQIGLNTGSVEWITVGKFTAIEVLKTAYSTKVTAYGFSTSKTSGTFTIPQTLLLSNIASAISTATGCTVSFESGINPAYQIFGSIASMSCYAGLQLLAHLCGGYVTDTNDGGIIIRRFSNTATLSVSTEVMKELPDVEEAPFNISGVKVTVIEAEPDADPPVAEVSYTYGNPVILYDSNPNMSADIFNNIYKSIVGYSYKTGTIDLSLGDPRIEGNDVLSVTDVNGNVYTVPCHVVIHTFDGGLSTTVRAVKATSGADGIATIAPITQRVDDIAVATSIAKSSADTALHYAEVAKETTDEIVAYAEVAGKTVTQILNDAEVADQKAQEAIDSAQNAGIQAGIANVYANSALDQLGVVQDVVGVLDLLSNKAEYRVTTDEEVQGGKWYFTRSGTSPNYVYSVVDNPQSVYHLTSDTAIDSTKTYYTRSGTGTEDDPYVYTEVASPVVADIGAYYEKYYEMVSIDASVKDYITSRLVVTSDGLSIQDPTMQTRILLSPTEGVVLKGANGTTIGKYGETAQIGDLAGFHIDIGDTYTLTTDTAIESGKTYYTRSGDFPNYTYTEVTNPVVADIATYYEKTAEIGFYQGLNKVAYINNNQLYITQSVVLQQMDLGMIYDGITGFGQWSWKVHKNGQNPSKNNLNLKWIG